MASREDESIALGPYAPWIGPGIFALSIATYLAVAGFEWYVVSSRPEPHALFMATHGAHSSSSEYVAHVHWRASALLLIGTAVAAGVVSTVMAAAHWRKAAPQLAAMAVFVALVWFIQREIGGGAKETTSLLASLQPLIGAESDIGNNLRIASQAKTATEALAVYVGIAVASILILPRKIDAIELARRIEQLRLMLFVSAPLFAAAILTNAAAYSWLVAALSWDGGVDAATPRAIVVAGTYISGAFYTLTLSSIFLPSAAVVVLLGRRLARSAEGDPEVWLQTHGLTFTWQGQFANIGALLAPLASTLIAQILSSAT